MKSSGLENTANYVIPKQCHGIKRGDVDGKR